MSRRARALASRASLVAASLGLLACTAPAEPAAPRAPAPASTAPTATLSTTSTAPTSTATTAAVESEPPTHASTARGRVDVEAVCAPPGVVRGRRSPETPPPPGVQSVPCKACGYAMWPDWLDCPQCRTRRTD